MNIENFMVLEKNLNENKEAVLLVNLGEFRKLKDYKELYVHILKTVTAAVLKSKENNNEQYVVKANFENAEIKNADAGFIGQLVTNLQELFPNRLRKCYLYYPPKIFLMGWKLITPFIDPVTKDKFTVVTKNGELHINDYESKFKDRV